MTDLNADDLTATLTALRREDPLFSRLSPVELARLLPHLRLHSCSRQQLQAFAEGAAERLVRVVSGGLSLQFRGRAPVTVRDDWCGCELLLKHRDYLASWTAMDDEVRLVSVDAAALEVVLAQHGDSRDALLDSLLRQMGADATGRSREAGEPQGRDGAWRRNLGWLAALSMPVLIYNAGPLQGLAEDVRTFLAVFAATILLWVMKLVPDYVAGLLTVLVVLILGIAPNSVVLEGFQSSSFFMALSIFTLAAVIASSGLLYRCSLLVLRHTPPTAAYYNLALTLSGLLLTPILPSINGRVSIIVPMICDLSDTLGNRRGGSQATRLAISGFVGVSLFSSVFLSAKSINFVVFGMLSTQAQESYPWLNWLLAASVAGVVAFLLFILLSRIFFGGQQTQPQCPGQVAAQLRMLGPMTAAEWGALLGILLLMLGVMTTSLHKIHPAWISFGLMFVFIAIGMISRSDFQRKLDWPFLFMLGILLGLANTISYLQIDALLGQRIAGVAGLLEDNIYLFVLVLAALIFVIRLALSINATVVMVASVFLPLADAVGFDTWVMGFMILTLSESFIFPYQSSYYLAMESANDRLKLYDGRLFLRFNALVALIRVAVVLVSVPYWQALDMI